MTHHLAVLLLSAAAFGALALAMERHQDEVFARALAPSTTRALRGAGWLLLGAALVLAVRNQGWSLGLVSYSGHTSVGAGLVFGLLVVRGRIAHGRGLAGPSPPQ